MHVTNPTHDNATKSPRTKDVPLLVWLMAATLFLLPGCASPETVPTQLIFQQGQFSHETVAQKMTWVEGGTFDMGAETLMFDERPIHEVTVSSFYLSKTEVTQEEWMAVMGSNPSFQQNKAFPVESVTWYDAINFLNRLSVMEGLEPVYAFDGNQVAWDRTKNGYRLPTEAEWEYAARGGIQSRGFAYAGSNDLDEIAHYMGNNEDDRNKPVATKKPNELGLFDMTGNVYEWTWDWKTPYTEEPKVDPVGNVTGESKSVRGGSAFCAAPSLYLGWRNAYVPTKRQYFVGFRVAKNAAVDR